MISVSHYIPPRNFDDVHEEFIVPVPDDYFIWWLFRHRCVMCYQPATEINEIVPRGRSKKSILDWRNRVTLCRTCHAGYHGKGVTNQKMEQMREKRLKSLEMLGRQEYIGL